MLRQLLVLEHFQVGVYRFLAHPAQQEQREARAQLVFKVFKVLREVREQLAFKVYRVLLVVRAQLG
jgi:ABC-type branched-subunit amino acid transport system ATPase component